MTDPCSFLPYQDPYENPSTDDILNLLDNRNPTLQELSMDEPFSQPFSFPPSVDGIVDAADPFLDSAIWGMHDEPLLGNSQLGPSEIHGENSNQSEPNWQTKGSDFEDSRLQVSLWPPQPVPFCCSYCQVLREIIHTNGSEFTILEIHGRLGMICHAILDIPYSTHTNSLVHNYQMFDFCKKSIEDVKQFLTEYCKERKQAGFLMMKDPLSIFYEALCVGIVGDENRNHDELNQPSSSNSGDIQMDQAADDNVQQVRNFKTSLAAQRQRTGKLTLKDIGNYFHLPIEEAAKQMRLCPTVVKKICRRDGLARWPHRKIKSIERQISNHTASLSSNDPQERARAQAEVQRLQQEMAKIREGAA